MTDHLGTPTTLVDSGGTITYDVHYSAFGLMFPEVGGSPLPNFTSGEFVRQVRPGQLRSVWDVYYHNGYRTYDYVARRYLQSDPIGLGGGVNTYSYVENNPLRFIDPDGLLSRSEARRRYNEKFGPRIPGSGSVHGPFGPVCGPEGSSLATFIPDGPMTRACKQHDLCYSTCGRTQEECDRAFFLSSQGPVGPLYAAAVAGFGRPVYEAAQREAGCKPNCGD